MATLLRRNNGVFYIVATVKRKRIWTSLHTRDESSAREAFQEAELEKQRKLSPTLRMFAEDFLQRASLSLSSKSISMYSQAFKDLLRVCGNKDLRKITPLLVESFKLHRAKEVSPVSVNIQLRSLRAAFGEAKRLMLIDDNPFSDVKHVRVPHKEGKYISEQEFSALLRSIDEIEFKQLLTFAVLTMMRLGEIINLRWIDVDLQRKEIHVRSNEEFRVKGGKPRIIPMNDWVYEFLIAKPKKHDRIFTKTNGWPLIGGTVSKKFKKSVRKAHLDNAVHFHSLRHTGISWLVNKGVPPQFVQRIAGHSSLNVTQIYTHLEDKNLITAVNAFTPIG